jgi:hypothetical protein
MDDIKIVNDYLFYNASNDIQTAFRRIVKAMPVQKATGESKPYTECPDCHGVMLSTILKICRCGFKD